MCFITCVRLTLFYIMILLEGTVRNAEPLAIRAGVLGEKGGVSGHNKKQRRFYNGADGAASAPSILIGFVFGIVYIGLGYFFGKIFFWTADVCVYAFGGYFYVISHHCKYQHASPRALSLFYGGEVCCVCGPARLSERRACAHECNAVHEPRINGQY